MSSSATSRRGFSIRCGSPRWESNTSSTRGRAVRRKAAGRSAPGATDLRRILEGQQRVTATIRRPDGRTLHVRTATQAEPEQRAVYDALGVDPQPGGVRKTII